MIKRYKYNTVIAFIINSLLNSNFRVKIYISGKKQVKWTETYLTVNPVKNFKSFKMSGGWLQLTT